MTNDAQAITKRRFIFTSEGYVDLEKALFLFFGPGVFYYVISPEQGFIVADNADGPSNIFLIEDDWVNPASAGLPKIAELAIDWLEGLSQEERERLADRKLRGGNHTATRLEGFDIHSLRNSSGEQQVLRIRPGWV